MLGTPSGRWDVDEWLSPPVPAALRDHVRSRHAYRLAVPPGELHVAVPQPAFTLILSLGPDHRMVDLRDGSEVVVDSFVAGLTEHASLVGADEFAGIQLDLAPRAAVALLGGAAADLRDHSVPVDDALGREATELRDRIREADGWAARVALVDRWLLRRLVDAPPPDPTLDRAWRLLDASRGCARIEAVADEVGWSTRHLRRRFKAAFGIGPKAAARVMRLHAAWQAIDPARSGDLGRIAVEHGYADQAHFSNEVREMTGYTPSVLLAGQRGQLSAMVSASSKPAASVGA